MSNFNQLDKALDNHEFDKVRSLIAAGVKPSVRPYGNCFHLILNQAWCAEWKVEMINLFASIGEDINYVPGMQNGVYTGSPLFMATLHNSIDRDVLKAMFENGAKDDRKRYIGVGGVVCNDWMP